MKRWKNGNLANYLLAVGMALVVFQALALPTARARAGGSAAAALPSLEEFVKQVGNGDAETLRGVYIPGVLALPVVQQPRGDSDYVSRARSALTQFRMASKAGNVGLLAHNYLAGIRFFELQPDDRIILVYGNGRVETFIVEGVYRYEALANGVYKNVEGREVLNGRKLFEVMYGGERHLTLQTCIAKGDDLNWGRLFVVAGGVDDLDARAEAPPEPVVVPKLRAAAPVTPPTLVLGWPLAGPSSKNNAANLKP